MTDLLNSGMFDYLKKDASERNELAVSADLSFTIRKGSIADKIKSDLIVINRLLVDAMSQMFNCCTSHQIEQIVQRYRTPLMNPRNESEYIELYGIAQGPDKQWYLTHDEGVCNGLLEYDIWQMIDLMAVCEDVVYTNKNTIKP